MGILKKSQNKMAFSKVGIYGEAGAGKTFTAAKMAIGLHKKYGLNKPVAMFDTEPAASFIAPLFEQAGIEFLVADESRALSDLMAFMNEAEDTCSIGIIDSITHVWKDVQSSFLKTLNDKRREQHKPPTYRLEFHHWGPIKENWGRLTDKYLSSKLHCIVCGRAGTIYSYQKNDETGKMELITTGTKMATEKEMGYEPSLLIEMVKHHEDGKLINRAIVEKDRADKLNGKMFDMPTFDDFKPHFDFLNIGGEHFGSMNKRDSSDMFNGSIDDDGWPAEKRNRQIYSEEIAELMKEYYPSQSADDKKGRSDIMQRYFGTKSWTKISENTKADILKSTFETMKADLAEES